ncbi:hypothetical protein EJ05DRAFT_478183 [Pseudovirgaria hyperparasitica]|uniref:Uncharacterized protein n=1 Tax=Pseudovirgaria hyperparasitica TaxID=470096 RepID=A0A6A6VZR1_9PEZI|nr:uncharacterized protein EJ05DRAFT_478183 [Pseudovirgaria hyperparasitica]KAF2756158.1 hypothetical protein EJ05DRAFT_478183 [Pseudovirgaria hyperparasitica]
MWSGIEDLVRLSAKEGIQIQFWCVPEGENHKANQLAWKPLEALVVEDPMEF